MASLNEVLAAEYALVFLNRDPTPREFAGWTRQLDAGVAPAVLAKRLAGTDRAQYVALSRLKAQGSPAQLVEASYEGILGRPPSSQELAFWVVPGRGRRAVVATTAASALVTHAEGATVASQASPQTFTGSIRGGIGRFWSGLVAGTEGLARAAAAVVRGVGDTGVTIANELVLRYRLNYQPGIVPATSIAPTDISFRAPEGATAVQTQTITITNNSTDRILSFQPQLVADPSSTSNFVTIARNGSPVTTPIQVRPGQSTQLTVSVNPNGLTTLEGFEVPFRKTIVLLDPTGQPINGANGQPLAVDVTLTIFRNDVTGSFSGPYSLSNVIASPPWGTTTESNGTMTLRITGTELRNGNEITVGSVEFSNYGGGGTVGSTFSGTFDTNNPQEFAGALDSASGIGLNFTISGNSINGRIIGWGSGTFQLSGGGTNPPPGQ